MGGAVGGEGEGCIESPGELCSITAQSLLSLHNIVSPVKSAARIWPYKHSNIYSI